MFNFPELTPKPIVHAEQHCTACNKWFALPATAREMLYRWWQDEGSGHLVRWVKCSHCGDDNLLMSVGKYDRPDTPRARCDVQYVVTE